MGILNKRSQGSHIAITRYVGVCTVRSAVQRRLKDTVPRDTTGVIHAVTILTVVELPESSKSFEVFMSLRKSDLLSSLYDSALAFGHEIAALWP